VSSILPKIQPLILDTSPAVRRQLLKLLNALPADNVGLNAEQILLYIRAGMMHLSTGIQLGALDVLEWLLNTAGPQVVSAPGGWLKTLATFTILLRWNSDNMTAHAGKVTDIASGWKSNTSATVGRSPEQINLVAKALRLLSVFLSVGLLETLDVSSLQAERARQNFPYTHFDQYMISQHSDPFGYLNLFGNSRDEESIAYGYTSERQKVFEEKYAQVFSTGLESAKKEGGNVGREASHCAKALEKCRSRYKVTEKKENLIARLG
jgi:pre-rRNA-processing protein IPI1